MSYFEIEDDIYHSGIKGMHWGIRRYQNEDGTLTEEGKKRYSESGISSEDEFKEKLKKEDRNKKIAAATTAIAAMTITAAGVYAAKNPEKVKSTIDKIKNVDYSKLSKDAVDKGKNYIKESAKTAAKNAKQGIDEGIKEGPRKVAKAAVVGSFMLGGKMALNKTVGQNTSDKIFKANDPKQIGKFWRDRQDD